MNGIGDFVASIKETQRLAAQIAIEIKGEAEGHPFRGNQYEGGGHQVGGRAPKGGTTGPNEEFYRGGSFVASTTMPKMTPRDKKRQKYMDSKQEIAPYTYEKPPSPDHFSVYRSAGVGVTARLDRSTGLLHRNENFKGMSGEGFDFTKPYHEGYSADELIDKYNNGERWTLPKS